MCGCCARTRAGIRFPEPRRVAMCPYRFAGLQIVGRHDLVFAALFLREQAIARDGERRPTRANRPAPQLFRRVAGPVGVDPHASNDAVSRRATKAGPFDAHESVLADCGSRIGERCRGLCRSRRALDRWRNCSGRIVRRSRPTRRRVLSRRASSRCSAVGVHRHSKSAMASPVMPSVRTSVSAPHPRRIAPAIEARRAACRKASAGRGPRDEREAQDRRGIDVQHESHHPVRNGLVNET